MAISESAPRRAPRGTKSLIRAFFLALAAIPEERRDEVARAAQTAIRAELQARRLKRGKSQPAERVAATANGRRGPGRPRKPV